MFRFNKISLFQDDYRRYIPLSTFGFYIDGLLNVKLLDFRVKIGNENDVVSTLALFHLWIILILSFLNAWLKFPFQYGFSLDKTLSDAMNPYLDTHQNKCILNDKSDDSQRNGPIAYFIMNLKDNK